MVSPPPFGERGRGFARSARAGRCCPVRVAGRSVAAPLRAEPARRPSEPLAPFSARGAGPRHARWSSRRGVPGGGRARAALTCSRTRLGAGGMGRRCSPGRRMNRAEGCHAGGSRSSGAARAERVFPRHFAGDGSSGRGQSRSPASLNPEHRLRCSTFRVSTAEGRLLLLGHESTSTEGPGDHCSRTAPMLPGARRAFLGGIEGCGAGPGAMPTICPGPGRCADRAAVGRPPAPGAGAGQVPRHPFHASLSEERAPRFVGRARCNLRLRLARVPRLRRRSSRSRMVGRCKPNYIRPKQIAGDPPPTAQADLYAPPVRECGGEIARRPAAVHRPLLPRKRSRAAA